MLQSRPSGRESYSGIIDYVVSGDCVLLYQLAKAPSEDNFNIVNLQRDVIKVNSSNTFILAFVKIAQDIFHMLVDRCIVMFLVKFIIFIVSSLF